MGDRFPLQTGTRRGPVSLHFYTHTHIHTCAHVHVHTDTWKARWPQQADCSETPGTGTVHPSVAGPLGWGGGQRKQLQAPFPMPKLPPLLPVPNTGLADLVIRPFLWRKHCAVLSKPQNPVRGVPHSASVGLFVCSVSTWPVLGTYWSLAQNTAMAPRCPPGPAHTPDPRSSLLQETPIQGQVSMASA